METVYTQAVVGAVARGVSPKDAAARLRETLVRRGHEQLLPKIGRELQRELAQQKERGVPTLTVARAADESSAKREVAAVLAELGLAPADVRTTSDDSLIGGWRLRSGSIRVDASYKKQLLTLYRSLTA